MSLSKIDDAYMDLFTDILKKDLHVNTPADFVILRNKKIWCEFVDKAERVNNQGLDLNNLSEALSLFQEVYGPSEEVADNEEKKVQVFKYINSVEIADHLMKELKIGGGLAHLFGQILFEAGIRCPTDYQVYQQSSKWKEFLAQVTELNTSLGLDLNLDHALILVHRFVLSIA